MLTPENLTTDLKALGVRGGDTLLVHASYKSLGGVVGGPAAVVATLLDVLTPAGTLIMPTFNFDFCKGAPWDVRTTPSHMGYMTELVRKDPRARRVFHPIYSFAIIGKHAEELTAERYTSSYGARSLFAKLRQLDGKIMVIGLSYTNSMTFFHHVEEMEGVDYRYMKKFTGDVIDWGGTTREESYTMLVRDIEKGVRTEVDPMGVKLEEAGIISVAEIGDAKVALMNANQVYDFTAKEMRREPGLLYYVEADK